METNSYLQTLQDYRKPEIDNFTFSLSKPYSYFPGGVMQPGERLWWFVEIKGIFSRQVHVFCHLMKTAVASLSSCEQAAITMIIATTRSCRAPTQASISHTDEFNVHLQLCQLQSNLLLNNFASKLHS